MGVSKGELLHIIRPEAGSARCRASVVVRGVVVVCDVVVTVETDVVGDVCVDDAAIAQVPYEHDPSDPPREQLLPSATCGPGRHAPMKQ